MTEIQVLTIEDDDDIRESVSEVLKMSGYDVITAQNGEEGLELALVRQPDVIVCDINMPGLSGFEVAERIRKDSRTEFTPFIFLSARATIDDMKNGLVSGGDDYLTKPFEVFDLLSSIDRLLQKRKRQEQVVRQSLESLLKELKPDAQSNALLSDDFEDALLSASRLQQEIMPSVEIFDKSFSDYFVFQKPRDIVSGDSIWLQQVEETSLLAVLDCTGHGVSAAMLVMACQSKLNLVVEQLGYRDPDQILMKVDELVKHFLGAGKSETFGMDVALCSINRKTMEVTFSSANRPVYFLRSKDYTELHQDNHINLVLENDQHWLYEIRLDSFGIGSFQSTSGFSSLSLSYEEGDLIYLHSDGFADQFGGPRDKKFLAKNLKSLLLSSADEGMNEQKTIISSAFYDWKGITEQTDDVIVFGLKL